MFMIFRGESMYLLLEEGLKILVEYSILAFEYIGVIIILVTGIHGVFNYMNRKPFVRLHLAKGLATGLEFKLGSEILRTVIVRGMSEMIIVAGIIILRAALTFLIHWEIKNEEESELREVVEES